MLLKSKPTPRNEDPFWAKDQSMKPNMRVPIKVDALGATKASNFTSVVLIMLYN